MATKTINELREIIRSRGYDGGNEEVHRWINTAERLILGHTDWPFLRAEITENAPYTISGLGNTIKGVWLADGNVRLAYEPFEHDVAEMHSVDGIAAASTPWGYTVQQTASGTQVRTVPYSTRELRIVWHRGAQLLITELDEEGYTTSVPEGYEDVLIDVACREGAKHLREWQEVAALTVEMNDGLLRMEAELLSPSSEPWVIPVDGDD